MLMKPTERNEAPIAQWYIRQIKKAGDTIKKNQVDFIELVKKRDTFQFK